MSIYTLTFFFLFFLLEICVARRERKKGDIWGEGGVEKGIKKTYHDSDIGHEEEDGFIHRYGDSDEQAWGNKNELNCTRKKKQFRF